MKVYFVQFTDPVLLPGGFNEKVIDLRTSRHHKAAFDVELDARGFIRVRLLKGDFEGYVAIIGPSQVRVAFSEPAAAAAVPKR